MKEIEERLNGLLNQVLDSKGKCVPEGITYKDISKVMCEGYSSQELVTVKIFLFSKGSTSNNKPYSIPDLVEESVFTEIRNDLRTILTDSTYGKFRYGDKINNLKKEVAEVEQSTKDDYWEEVDDS